MVWGKTPDAVLAAMGVPPDFRCETSAQTVKPRYIHRAAGETDIYFVANGSPQAVDAECMFRVKGKRPEFWHPDTGRIEPVAVYDEAAEGTRIPIWFDPGRVGVRGVSARDAGGGPRRCADLRRQGRAGRLPVVLNDSISACE